MTDDLRASDAERQEVGALLSRHFVEGRLDRGELDERLGTALSATTRGELAGLLFDLPVLDSAPPAAAPPRRSWRMAALALAMPLLAVPLSFAAHSHVSHVPPPYARSIPARFLPARLPPFPGSHAYHVLPNGAPYGPYGPYGGASSAGGRATLPYPPAAPTP